MAEGPFKSGPSDEVDTQDLKRPASMMESAGGEEDQKESGSYVLPLMELPDEILTRIASFVNIRGKVCRRWEHIKVLLARERCVQVLMKRLVSGREGG